MEEYSLDLVPADIGEIVSIIRIQHLKMHSEPFAEKIGLSHKVLNSIEDGHSPHGMLALRKISKTFPNVKIKLNVTLI
jgi:hypothetical protein